MELKEYIRIIKKNLLLFLAVVLVIVTSAFLYFTFRPVFYDVSLTLNITRQGSQITDQFKYDDFYRLQADEKFSETVVEWMKTARVSADILGESGIDTSRMSLSTLSRTFRAEKLSAQVVGIRYQAPDIKTAEKLSFSTEKVLSRITQDLNRDQKEDTWFQLSSREPVIIKNDPDNIIIFMISLTVGIFVAFWVVMGRHYLSE